MKPAEQTPLTCLRLARLAQKAGIPDGVINVVPGYGPTAGAAIVKHPGVDKVAFTGEHRTAQIIMRDAATTLKRLTFELGGKSPNIVFADADLDAAVAGAHVGLYLNQGQCCCAGSRLFVQDKVYDKFIDKLVGDEQERRVGDPFDPETQQGPQIDQAQFDKIMHYVELGKKEGAKCVTGGERHRRARLLHRADPVRRSDRRHDDRQGRNFWAGDVGAASSRTPTKSSSGPTTRSMGWPRPSGRATSARPTAWPRPFGPARCGSTATTCSTPGRRSAASRCRASAASWAKRAWKPTPRPKPSPSAWRSLATIVGCPPGTSTAKSFALPDGALSELAIQDASCATPCLGARWAPYADALASGSYSSGKNCPPIGSPFGTGGTPAKSGSSEPEQTPSRNAFTTTARRGRSVRFS